jgi:flagellar biosynthesis/type III secretory pathway protein FliH
MSPDQDLPSPAPPTPANVLAYPRPRNPEDRQRAIAARREADLAAQRAATERQLQKQKALDDAFQLGLRCGRSDAGDENIAAEKQAYIHGWWWGAAFGGVLGSALMFFLIKVGMHVGGAA